MIFFSTQIHFVFSIIQLSLARFVRNTTFRNFAPKVVTENDFLFKINEKWVLISSTLHGCPVKCKFCDAGNFYSGKPTKEEILFQIDYLIKNRFSGIHVPSDKFKIQFSRMGEPTFNPAVLEALRELPNRYIAPGFYPSLPVGGKEDSKRAFAF